jgi:hypothetical protein
MEVGSQCHAPAALPQGNIIQKAGRAPGPVWMGMENLALTRFDPWTIQLVAHSLY